MNLEKVKEDFDFFKNEKYRKLKEIKACKQVFLMSMTSIAIIFSGAMIATLLKTMPNQKQVKIEVSYNDNSKNITSDLEVSNNISNLSLEEKNQELKKIAQELKEFEKNQYKNEPNKTIKNVDSTRIKEFIQMNKELDPKIKKDLIEYGLVEYGDKIKDQKFTKEDMDNMIKFFEQLKKQDAEAFSKIRIQENP